MARQCGEAVTRMNIPQPDRVIVTGTGKTRTIRAKRDRLDAASMSLQRMQTFACTNLPQPNGLVIATAGQEAASIATARSVGNTPDTPGMSSQQPQTCPCGALPQPNDLVIAPAGDRATIRAKGDRPEAAFMPTQGV